MYLLETIFLYPNLRDLRDLRGSKIAGDGAYEAVDLNFVVKGVNDDDTSTKFADHHLKINVT